MGCIRVIVCVDAKKINPASTINFSQSLAQTTLLRVLFFTWKEKSMVSADGHTFEEINYEDLWQKWEWIGSALQTSCSNLTL